MSTPAHWDALKSAFAELAALASPIREARLADLRAHDPEFADALAALLTADETADDRLAHLDLLTEGAEAADRHEPGVDPLGLSGRDVAHFRVHEVLGSGGMGVAYRAEDTRLGRVVALKFLLPQHALDPAAKRRLLHEARTASALDHPNVCTLLEIGESAHGLFLAMPAYAGDTLRQRLEHTGPLAPDEATGIVRQVLHGLAAAHAAGITHRDLKPGNLVCTPDGTIKILDFGLAEAVDPALSTPHPRAGTVAYMSPEQLLGDPVDARSDLWSVGVLLYELLTGVRPFGGGHDLSTAYAILHEDPPPPSTRAHDVPPDLDALVLRLLRRDPAERYESAGAVIAALDHSVTSPTAPPAPPRARVRRALIAGALVLVAAATVAVPILRRSNASIAGVAAEQASVAVLPFVDTSPARDQQHLGEGMAEEILNALIAVPGVRVTARPSTLGMRDSDASVLEIAHELGVAAVLEGSVHRAADRVRVTARLLDAESGRYLWSRTFERPFADIFAVQSEIARTVADALQVHVAPGAMPTRPTENLAAYELYLRGIFHWNRRTGPDLRQAIDVFTQATQHDSTFARAWAGLALTYVVLAVFDQSAVDLLPRTHDAAARALALDPDLAEAHAARGYAFHWQWQWHEAEASLRRALALNPEYATAHQWLGEHLVRMGRGEAGEWHMRRAIELDPLSLVAQNDLGIILMMQGRLDESIAQLERAQAMDPAFPLPQLLLHRVHLMAGNVEESAQAGRRWAEMSRLSDADELVLLVRATKDPALRDSALSALALRERRPRPRWVDIAMYAELLGDRERAIRAIEESLRLREPMLPQLAASPWALPLHSEPRVQAVLAAMGLREAR